MTVVNSVGNSLTGLTGTGKFVGDTSPTIVTPVISQINDTNANAVLTLANVASAVNYTEITNSSTGNPVQISAKGTDSNIPINLISKGSSPVRIYGGNTTAGLTVYNGTSSQHSTAFSFSNTSAARTITVPDSDGTMAFTANVVTQVNMKVFTSSGTYTPTSGMKYAEVIVVAGGGGGGSSSGGTASIAVYSTGGGAGAVGVSVLSAATIGASQTVTVATAASAGADGGSTTFGSLVGAQGGVKGLAGIGGTTQLGGNGGAPGTAQIGIYGANGWACSNWANAGGFSGRGGDSSYGRGGKEVVSAGNGNSGTGYGAGGGGAVGFNGTTGTGGSGAPGLCVVIEYI